MRDHVQGIAGGIGGSEHRARNFALVGMGFSAAGFIGPFLAGLAIDHLGRATAVWDQTDTERSAWAARFE